MPSNARGKSKGQGFAGKPPLPQALKQGQSQTVGQHIPESAVGYSWEDTTDPLWQQNVPWDAENPQGAAIALADPNPMEPGLFPRQEGQAYLEEMQRTQNSFVPIDLGDEGQGPRMQGGLWPNAGPSQQDTVAWYSYQISLNPNVVEHVAQRNVPSTKPFTRTREVHIPRARYILPNLFEKSFAHIFYCQSE